MLVKTFFVLMVLASCFTLEPEKKEAKGLRRLQRGKEDIKVRKYKEVTRSMNSKKPKQGHKVKQSRQHGLEDDVACTSMGAICQLSRYICQGRYLKNKCPRPTVQQCCLPGPGAWHTLCATHHQNRVRGCDRFGCGAFKSDRPGDTHKAVDVVCDDFTPINAPFSGTLGGPVSDSGDDGIQYDGVKLYNSEYCVKIFNIRPYRYLGPISKGEALGYLLPLQERFSGITPHLELQMCDQTDPTPFI